MLSMTSDQSQLLNFLKSFVQEKLAEGPICMPMTLELANTMLCPLIDIFCAYYACDNFKVIRHIYAHQGWRKSDRLIGEKSMRQLLEPIQDLIDMMTQLSTIEPSDEHRKVMAQHDNCVLLHSCGYLLQKLKEITDYLITELSVYRPQVKLK